MTLRSGDTLPTPAQYPLAPRPTRLLTPTLRDIAREALRHRAVLREGNRRDQLARRGRKHQPLDLSPEQAEHRPRLAAYLLTHSGWPPSVTRNSTARLRELDTMYAACGPLVLLTVNLDTLDELPLKSEELRDLARELVAVYLDGLTAPGTPYAAAVQRGLFGGTHAHLALPLACLSAAHAALVQAARRGAGGGCELLSGDAHAVLMGNRPNDRARVAAYIARDPDGRLAIPGVTACLDALEEELERKASGQRSPRLSWSHGVTALRRAVVLSD